MKIEKKLYLQLLEVADATCHNSYLMDDGEILTNEQYKKLSFIEKLSVVMFFKYSTRQVIKI